MSIKPEFETASARACIRALRGLEQTARAEILKADGDRDYMNSSNLTVQQTTAIADFIECVLRRLRSAPPVSEEMVTRGIKAACSQGGRVEPCQYPTCSCRYYPDEIRAALTAALAPGGK